MASTEGDPQAGAGKAGDGETAPVLVTRLFRSFPAFVEEYASRVALSGTFVTAIEPLPVGTRVHVDFQLRDGFRLFHGVGEVGWVRTASGGPDLPAGMGIRFLALDDKGRSLLLRMLEEHIKDGGQPFDLEPLPPGATTDPTAVPRRGEAIEGDDTLGLTMIASPMAAARSQPAAAEPAPKPAVTEPVSPAPEPTADTAPTPAPIDDPTPVESLPDAPVSEIVDVSFAFVEPTAGSDAPTSEDEASPEEDAPAPEEAAAAPTDDDRPVDDDRALDASALEESSPPSDDERADSASAFAAVPDETSIGTEAFALPDLEPNEPADGPPVGELDDGIGLDLDGAIDLDTDFSLDDAIDLDSDVSLDDAPASMEDLFDLPSVDDGPVFDGQADAPATDVDATVDSDLLASSEDDLALSVPPLDNLSLGAMTSDASSPTTDDDDFAPPWSSALPEIPEEFLESDLDGDDSVGGDELAAIAEAAEAASHVELPPPDEVPVATSPAFDLSPMPESTVAAPTPSPTEPPSSTAASALETIRLDQTVLAAHLPSNVPPEVEPPTAAPASTSATTQVAPLPPAIDFGVEDDDPLQGWAPPATDDIVPMASDTATSVPPPLDPQMPSPPAPETIDLPTIPPAAAVETMSTEPDAPQAPTDEATSPEASAAPYWLDETGSAMRRERKVPRSLLALLAVAALGAGAFFSRDTWMPLVPGLNADGASAGTPASAPAQPAAGSAEATTDPATAPAVEADGAGGETQDGETSAATQDAAPAVDSAPSAAAETEAEAPSAQPTPASTGATAPPTATAVPPARTVAPPRAPVGPPGTQITSIDWAETENGTLVTIGVDGSIDPTRVEASQMGGNAPRVLVRIAGIDAPYVHGALDVGNEAIRRIRTGFHPSPRGNALHIVLDLTSERAGLVGDVLPGSDGRIELLVAAH